MNAALILSGGSGQRFESSLPKQYHKIRGKMVIEYVLEAALHAKNVDKVLVAAMLPCPALSGISGRYAFDTVMGGQKRNETLKNGLDALNALNCENVIILDAVRPLVTGELIDEYLLSLDDGWDAVTTAQRITDSLGCLDAREVRRDRYYLMQSPEAFRFKLLYENFSETSPLTEVAQQLPEGSRLRLYFDFPQNPKLTYPWEKAYIAYALKARRR